MVCSSSQEFPYIKNHAYTGLVLLTCPASCTSHCQHSYLLCQHKYGQYTLCTAAKPLYFSTIHHHIVSSAQTSRATRRRPPFHERTSKRPCLVIHKRAAVALHVIHNTTPSVVHTHTSQPRKLAFQSVSWASTGLPFSQSSQVGWWGGVDVVFSQASKALHSACQHNTVCLAHTQANQGSWPSIPSGTHMHTIQPSRAGL
jgi:hypothetical protein